MSKFNKSAVAVSRAAITSPIAAATLMPDTLTGNGAQAWSRDAKGELFLLAVTNMVGEDTFYEGAGERDQRFRALVRVVALEDREWISRFIPWLRNEANMRSASIVAAIEAALAVHGMRSVVASALQRPDEPAEALAYLQTRIGKRLPKPIKRGIADAATRLYSEYSMLKYDTASHDIRFGDVLELTHAIPRLPAAYFDSWDADRLEELSSDEIADITRKFVERQGDLFKHAIDRRHNRPELEIPESLQTLRLRKELDALPVDERRALVKTKDPRIGLAGYTWEALSGWLQGPMDKDAWEAVIPNMGYMALIRNLRNFDQAGVSDAVAKTVIDKITDPVQIARSRQLPMRFLSAYNAAPSLRWAWPLEQALEASLENVPVLRGRTLILVDTSGSMNAGFSKDGTLMRWDAAAMFGIALASRADKADVVSFSSDTKDFPLVKGESVLKSLQRFKGGYFFGGGTATVGALQRHYSSHDRVVILTDEQANGYSHGLGGGWNSRSNVTVSDAIPAHVPLYNFNLAGYRAGSTPTGKENRHTFGGLTDTGFKMLAMLEQSKSAKWPWES